MKKITYSVVPFAAGFACLAGLCGTGFAQLPAFPGAQGFGRFATGGRGGTVYHVTNLNDSGPGSFRDAVSGANRTVIFDVGGLIRITNRISVAQNVTIAGQTAPGDGLTVYGNGISFSGAHNAIVRFIRFRQGMNGSGGTDAVTMTGNSHDMIFDHLSVSWGLDETFSISSDSAPYPTNITIQSMIIAQGLQTHSAGGLIQTPGGVSILRSLYIENDTRNPKFKFNSEYVNNVVYGWETAAYIMGGDSAGDSYANAFNNYFINGANGGGAAFSGGNENFHIFATNNWQDANQDGVLNGSEIPFANYGPMDLQSTPWPYPITNALPPLTALKLVISDAGDSWRRDAVDRQLMTDLTSWGTLGQTIHTEFDAPMSGPGTIRNGTPYTDTDQDGMPDFWEAALGMNPNAANNNVTNASGYTQLEEYLNWLAEPHGIAPVSTTVCVDLRQLTRGFTNSNPVYSVANATNGMVTLFNGCIARFVPTTGYAGPAGFQFTVTDADGSTITCPMNLFFTSLAQSFNPVWRGDGVTNNWNTLGDYDWFDGQSLLFPFRTGDSVIFDDTGSTSPEVNLVGSLQPGSVTFTASKTYGLSGVGSLDGAMNLTLAGSGTLELDTANHFTGATSVSNGTLLVNGSLDQSPVTVLSGGVLGGGGQLGLTPTLLAGAALAPGNGIGDSGTLTITNGLTESGGITDFFDLTEDPTGLIKTNDQIRVIGNLALSGTNVIKVNLLDGPLVNGVYTLITYSGTLTGGLTNLVVVGANGALTNPPGAIALSVDNNRAPASLVWLGNAGNNTWDTGTNAAWRNGANQDWFYFGDSVLFDDSGSTNPPVTVAGTVSPAFVTVNATKNYNFNGNGKISGTTGLTKTNSGTLTIATTNDYTGVTTIAGGTLSIAQIANGGAPCGLGAAANTAANLLLNGGTLRYTGASVSTDRGITLNPGGGAIDVSSSGTVLTLSNGITGAGQLVKTGAGRLDPSVAGDYGGGTVVNGGTLRLVTDTGLGSGVLTLNGTTNSTTLQFAVNGGSLNNPLNVVGPNNFTINNVNNTVNALTGNGTLTLNTGTTFSFGGDMTGFSGTIQVGTLTNPRFYPSTGSSNALVDLGNTSALLNTRNGGATIQVGALSGGPNTQLQGASSAVNNGSPTTYVIGGKNLDTTFAGRMTQVIVERSVALVKVGNGTLTLTGMNTNTGTTTVNGGTLLVNTPATYGLGTNTVTVNNGGTLGGTGLVGGAVTVNAGGALAPGGPNNIGTLSISNSLALNSAANLWFECGTGCDKVAVTNNLALGGTLNLTNLPGFGPGTNVIFTYGGALSGSLAIGNQPAGYSCTVVTDVPKQVRLAVTVSASPRFSNVHLSADGLIFEGDGGTANGLYYVLTSTNVVSPINTWKRAQTNQFDTLGTFIFTNALSPAIPQNFYRLQLP
ncbi:MAG TPA: autotransporter-associated beta strand repeat-containing protein [Candidatus Acidoferrum sp.]|nr:autotransporter-associated beta strand repeat-containing protein [Candidatus Acidoferrum sp.]